MNIPLIVFWGSFFCIFYTYIGYAILLIFVAAVKRNKDSQTQHPVTFPSISLLIPVHNEEKTVEMKIENLKALNYPADRLDILFISDGSTDHTCDIINKHRNRKIRLFKLEKRGGKAAALNLGLSKADKEIVVFTDASIMLEKNALINLVQRFSEPRVGCVSGEDHIAGKSGEGLYGRYELLLRNLESAAGSIVGASGSFYGQRRDLCENFIEGMAPDFLSVLNTVEKGYLAVTEPKATGEMTAVKEVKDEFARKVRTLIRGMTALFAKLHLLNPFYYGFFSVQLISHKILRWLVPFFLILTLLSNLALLQSLYYFVFFVLQMIFYLLAILSYFKIGAIGNHTLGKIPLYFVSVNYSIIKAWIKYLKGFRQELWNPSQRS